MIGLDERTTQYFSLAPAVLTAGQRVICFIFLILNINIMNTKQIHQIVPCTAVTNDVTRLNIFFLFLNTSIYRIDNKNSVISLHYRYLENIASDFLQILSQMILEFLKSLW